MAQRTVTIPDAVLTRVLDAFAKAYGFTGTKPDPANPTGPQIPQTKAQFFDYRLMVYIKDVTKGVEANDASGTAGKVAADKAETDFGPIN